MGYFKNILLIVAALVLSTSCKGGGKGADKASVKAKQYSVDVVATYPHSTSSYTQGLFFHDGHLYESTGQYGESFFAEVDLESGKALRRFDLDGRYFGEGSQIFDGKLYLLTWRNYVTLIYDSESFRLLRTVTNIREGWGLTTDGKSLIMSDGSSNIYFLDADFKVQKRIVVKNGKKSVGMLNELEWIDGRIWANVYLTDKIVIINPENGVVEGVVDCEGLLPDELRTPETDVLNGIAYNPADGKIYLTGKLWPQLYEVKIKEK